MSCIWTCGLMDLDTILPRVQNYLEVTKFIRFVLVLLGNVIIVKDVCKMGSAMS